MKHLGMKKTRKLISKLLILPSFGHLYGQFAVQLTPNIEDLQIYMLKKLLMVKSMVSKSFKTERSCLELWTEVQFMITFSSQKKMSGNHGLILATKMKLTSSPKILKCKILSSQLLTRLDIVLYKSTAFIKIFQLCLLVQLVRVNQFISKTCFLISFLVINI